MMRSELPSAAFQGSIQNNNINGGNGESASSLFMRYVKSKLVKKIKTD